MYFIQCTMLSFPLAGCGDEGQASSWQGTQSTQIQPVMLCLTGMQNLLMLSLELAYSSVGLLTWNCQQFLRSSMSQ